MNASIINQSYYKNLFENTIIPYNDVVLTNGTANFENNSLFAISSKSLQVNVGSFKTTDVKFNFGKALETNALDNGSYFFSFGVKSDIAFQLIASVVLEGADAIEMMCDVENEKEGYQTFGQYFEMNRGDSFNVSFTIKHDINADSNSTQILLDGFCLEQNVSNNYLPKGYAEPNNNTGYQSRTDLVNEVTLTATAENTIVINGTIEENGGLELLDANSKIIPINKGDVIQIDFACTLVTPTGSDNYIDAKLLVDGVAYRSLTHQLIKGSGNEDSLSVSWCVPIGADILLNGAVVSLNPNVTLVCKNRYIQVTRLHKAR